MRKKSRVIVAAAYSYKWLGQPFDEETLFHSVLNFEQDAYGNLRMDDASKKEHQQLTSLIDKSIKETRMYPFITKWKTGVISVEIQDDDKESKAEFYLIESLSDLRRFYKYSISQLAHAAFMPEARIFNTPAIAELPNAYQVLPSKSQKPQLNGYAYKRICCLFAFDSFDDSFSEPIYHIESLADLKYEVYDGLDWRLTKECFHAYDDFRIVYQSTLEMFTASSPKTHWYKGITYIETKIEWITNAKNSFSYDRYFEFIDISNTEHLSKFTRFLCEDMHCSPYPFEQQQYAWRNISNRIAPQMLAKEFAYRHTVSEQYVDDSCTQMANFTERKKAKVIIGALYSFNWPRDNDRRASIRCIFDYMLDQSGILVMDDLSKQRYEEFLNVLNQDVTFAMNNILQTTWQLGLISVEIKDDDKKSAVKYYVIKNVFDLHRFYAYAQSQLRDARFMPDAGVESDSVEIDLSSKAHQSSVPTLALSSYPEQMQFCNHEEIAKYSKMKLVGFARTRICCVFAFEDPSSKINTGLYDIQRGFDLYYNIYSDNVMQLSVSSLRDYRYFRIMFDSVEEQIANKNLYNTHWCEGTAYMETTDIFYGPERSHNNKIYQTKFIRISSFEDFQKFASYLRTYLPFSPYPPQLLDNNTLQRVQTYDINAQDQNPENMLYEDAKQSISSLASPLILSKHHRYINERPELEAYEAQEGILEYTTRKLWQCFSC